MPHFPLLLCISAWKVITQMFLFFLWILQLQLCVFCSYLVVREQDLGSLRQKAHRREPFPQFILDFEVHLVFSLCAELGSPYDAMDTFIQIFPLPSFFK